MDNLFNNNIKAIKKLHQKKGRNESGLFIIESIKTVFEADATLFEYVVFDQAQLEQSKKLANFAKSIKCPCFKTNNFDKISTLKNSEGILAVAKTPKPKSNLDFFKDSNNIICLYEANDPGNLGTILRTALWFGVEKIILIGNCVDIYSPKVIRSSMGGNLRIDILQIDNFDEIKSEIKDFFKIGTFLQLKSTINDKNLQNNKKKILFLGNEANGLPISLQSEIDSNYLIKGNNQFESLNLSIAAGIAIHEIFSK